MLFFNTSPPVGPQSLVRRVANNAALAVVSLLLCLLAVEAGYRIFDPFPYISQNESTHTEFGNLSEYDQLLGWRGVPSAQAEFITSNSRTWLKNNQQGFRDIEHPEAGSGKPAMVFLGDSFTWGYEVSFEEMFVNRLRARLPQFEIYNLSHRGYGTDQELLTFKSWKHPGQVSRVILMMSENDVEDNNSDYGSGKPKPAFRLINGQLALTGTPVPALESWTAPPPAEKFAETRKTKFIEFFLRSHLIHDVAYRILLHRQAIEEHEPPSHLPAGNELTVTFHILQELKKETAARKAELIVFFIPSKREIEHFENSAPYQIALAELCSRLAITYYDLAPEFKKVRLRSYYRQGMHWNPHGNKVAADAIYRRLQGR
jgi:lysophospholipase L1-like esterase